MSDKIKFTVDGQEGLAEPGQTIYEAAKANGIYIPVLCHFEGLKPVGSCRICSVKSNGRWMASCTQPVTQGMIIENMTPEVEEYRKALIEMLFVEGNHFCPACEKSGNCELQALAYRYQIMVPRFPYLFPKREIEAFPKFLLEHNRCVQCQRCVRGVQTEDGQKIFALHERSNNLRINVDRQLATEMSNEQVQQAMDICPVGAILKKEAGFRIPIGKRKFDYRPIGSEIEEKE
ncbi:MAG: 2Fe-2S iron-sulfur cluster-binding protein [Acidobacteriota bacterium]|nr:2Fe-2S iron-sulfur cluster-binding protein [Acidobacteriota bacterium]MDW3228275.1 2Fe-2S iron-sulfur cluster-binding protein [Acidobacteriota bacterium]MDY0230982.1 2Fe-2S iron-sulfur cluster-binding protein [Candidatus Saccharicenans sp.]